MDGVYDLVGGEALEEVAELLKDRSKLVTAGDPATAGRLGGAMVRRARTGAVLAEVADLVIAGELRPFVTRDFPLDQAADAMRSVERGHAGGKIVIEVAA